MKNSPERKIIVAKRIFDIVFSLIILALTLPFVVLALACIKCEQILRGRPFDPFFYSETRHSYGQPFTLYKFNIFKYEEILAARARGEFIHTKRYEHNGGILKTGWILKQIYMDELPQFWSVLKGDMSIIGPRPVNTEVYHQLKERGSHDKDRVPAGITGHFQSQKENRHADAINMDKEYADLYHSLPWYRLLAFDLLIIWRTLIVIVRARGI